MRRTTVQADFRFRIYRSARRNPPPFARMGKSRLVFKRLKVGPTSWAIMPRALMQFVKNNHVLHQCVVLATLLIEESPHIPHEERADITEVILSIDLRNITY
jgi:hypothetical protein